MEIKAIGCEPLQLKRMFIQDGHTLKVYRDTGGYESLKKAFQMSPADVIEEVKKSALRGRGGAGFLFEAGEEVARRFGLGGAGDQHGGEDAEVSNGGLHVCSARHHGRRRLNGA